VSAPEPIPAWHGDQVTSALLTWDEYAAEWSALHGGYDPSRTSPVVRGWLRLAYAGGRLLGRVGVGPTAVTAAGLVICLVVPLVAAQGPAGLLVGAALVLLAGVADGLDGAVAVVTKRVSRLGYVYDSLADRLGEAAWLAAFWLVGVPGPLVVAGGAASWLHEYLRARAAGAGMPGVGVVTVAERSVPRGVDGRRGHRRRGGVAAVRGDRPGTAAGAGPPGAVRSGLTGQSSSPTTPEPARITTPIVMNTPGTIQ
jgi:CDP-diacylglycerol--glycerol-3-phosphate 3-phosphatidyltransferase